MHKNMNMYIFLCSYLATYMCTCTCIDHMVKPVKRQLSRPLRCIKAWDMQFCVKNIVIQNSLYLEKSLRYVHQTWCFDCWYLNLI